MPLIDKYSFERKSKAGCSNSDYYFARTNCCGSIGIEDDELLDFYFNPKDLTKVIFLGKENCCPYCGSKEWDFEHLGRSDPMPPEWSWVAQENQAEPVDADNQITRP